jgi:hypothetical protein
LWGNASTWRKFHADPNLQVPIEVRRGKEYYKSIITAKPGKLQLVRCPEDEVTEKDVLVTRPMTFEELEVAMVAALEMKNFAEIHKSGESVFYEELVRRHRSGVLLNRPYLVVPPDEKDAFDGLLKELPEEQQKFLAEYIVPNKNNNLFCVDGATFVTELTYQIAYPDGETVAPALPPLPVSCDHNQPVQGFQEMAVLGLR